MAEPFATPQELLRRALALHKAGAMAEASALYRSVLASEPRNADALHLLGLAHKAGGKLESALASINAAIAVRPDFTDAHYNLGNTLGALGRTKDAIASFRTALALDPRHVLAAYNLGNTLRDLGDLEGAAAAFQAALTARPDHVESRHNLANVMKGLNRIDDSIAAYRASLKQRPALAEAHYNLGLALMQTGDFDEGLAQYEWRWSVDGFPAPRRNFRQPQWDGRPVTDKILLIHAEQAFGDAIQFCRYLPLIAGQARRIVFECRGPLLGLMRGLTGVDQLVEAGAPLPAFDTHAPLLSLPYILGTRLDTIPANVPYLRADPGKTAVWKQKRDQRFTVGLIWAGNKKPDPLRTIGLAAIEPLLAVPGVRCVALQRELEPGDVERLATLGPRLDHWGNAFADFTDTAAAMEAVELVISIDTGPAHLAGASGRPVWTLLPFAADWRWLMNRADSPWYPTMRLYRQEKRGDWGSVLVRVADDLKRVAK